MEYEIIRRPFMLLETMEMLFKYVNGISFRSLLSQRQTPSSSPTGDETVRKLELLQEIMEEVCRDIDPGDPKLRKYFELVKTDLVNSSICLARFLLCSFSDFRDPDFQASVDGVRAEWRSLNERGAWIRGYDAVGLNYTCEPGCPGDLFTQVYELRLPAEFRLKIYDALRRFDETIGELANLMYPTAIRLEAALQRAQPVLDGAADYWLKAPVQPLEFLAETVGPEAVQGAGERLRLTISLMCCDTIIHGMAHTSVGSRDYSFMHIGCCIKTDSLVLDRDRTFENISTTLKALGDKKRLEILQRLSKERSYGLELAEVMGMDPGNLSRSLTALYNYGFLRQERENLRTYYQTDREALQNFLDRLMAVIFK